MKYVKHILLPHEEVLYDGHVHPRVLAGGIIWLGLAAFILMESANTGGGHSILLSILYSLGNYIPPISILYAKLSDWQRSSPSIAIEIKIIALGMALYGISKLSTQMIIMQTTELVVTNLRIIAKTGLFTVITLEMDRNRVAGVTVYQSLVGRMMNYGYVFIQGFTSSIGGLPVMVNPHLVEKYVA